MHLAAEIQRSNPNIEPEKTQAMNPKFNIRLATYSDLEAIQVLNQKWIFPSFTVIDKRNGFLLGEAYPKEDLQKIIAAKELAVACHEEKIVGYVINDNFSSQLEKNEKAIKNLINICVLPPHLKISKRTQVVIDKDYQRIGIPAAMLAFLLPYLRSKYDVLFSTVLNDNPKRKAHEKAGWKFIFQDEIRSYCIYDLNLGLPIQSSSFKAKKGPRHQGVEGLLGRLGNGVIVS